MDIALVQELAADGLAGAAFEQHVVRHHDRGAAVVLQHRLDVLDEVELLVGGRGPEVVALDDVALLGDLRPLHRRWSMLLFFPKGGLVRTMSNRSLGSAAKAVGHDDGQVFIRLPMPCSNMFIAQSRVTLSGPVPIP